MGWGPVGVAEVRHTVDRDYHISDLPRPPSTQGRRACVFDGRPTGAAPSGRARPVGLCVRNLEERTALTLHMPRPKPAITSRCDLGPTLGKAGLVCLRDLPIARPLCGGPDRKGRPLIGTKKTGRAVAAGLKCTASMA